MIEKGFFFCEVIRIILSYEYCKNEDFRSVMNVLERLEKKFWVRIVIILVRKFCNDGKVDMAVLFFYKLLDK